MPGPPRWRTSLLVLHCLSSQKLLQSTIDKRVENLLTFVQRQAKRNPEVVYGDGIERTHDSPEARPFCRRVAADGIVLLKNRGETLPIKRGDVKHIAVIGPNARERVISGGGSAALKASYVVTPWDGLRDQAPEGLTFEYEVGCYGELFNRCSTCNHSPRITAHKYLPTLENYLITPTGEPGWLCTFYTNDPEGNLGKEVQDFVLRDTKVKLNDFLPEGLTPAWTIKLRGKLTVDKTAPFELGLTVAGMEWSCIIEQSLIDSRSGKTLDQR